MTDDPMVSPLYRWSRLCYASGHWCVWVETTHPWLGTHDGALRRVRWWSPRDLARFPLFWLWERRYW